MPTKRPSLLKLACALTSLFMIAAIPAAKQTVNTGSAANDQTGDPIRTAFTKYNANFDELYAAADAGVATVSTIAQATSFTPRTVGRIVQCLDPYRGGSFYMTNSAAGVDGGRRIQMSEAGWSLVRVDAGATKVTWYGARPDGGTYTTEIQAAINYTPTGGTLDMVGGTYKSDALSINRSDLVIAGNGATIQSATTNANQHILLTVSTNQNITIKDLTLDSVYGCADYNGNAWFKACTNITLENFTAKNGTHLANLVVVSHPSGAKSRRFFIRNLNALEQTRGTGGQSTASVSFAEDSDEIYLDGFLIDNPMTTTANTSTIGLGIDRANVHVKNGVIRNFAGGNGFTMEDNSRAASTTVSLENVLVEKCLVGGKTYYGIGALRLSEVTFRQNKTYGFQHANFESADWLSYVPTLDHCHFIDNWTSGHSFTGTANTAGQLLINACGVLGTEQDRRTALYDCDFTYTGVAANYPHIVFGSGELIAENLKVTGGAYGVARMNYDQNNPFFTNRKKDRVYIRGLRSDGTTTPIHNLINYAGQNNLGTDPATKIHVVEDRIFKAIGDNSVSRLFDVVFDPQTGSSANNGATGSYTVEVDLTIAYEDENEYLAGSNFGRAHKFAFIHCNTQNPVANFNSEVSEILDIGIDSGGGRSAGPCTATVSSSSNTTTVYEQTDLTGTSGAWAYGTVKVTFAGYYFPPRIVK